jgi:hypothetical protein
MLVRRAIAICRCVSGRSRVRSASLLAVMPGGLPHLVGAKSDRACSSTYRSVEHRHREDGHDNSRPVSISVHEHLKPTIIDTRTMSRATPGCCTRNSFYLRDFDAWAGRLVETAILPDQRSSEERCKLNWSRMRRTVCSTRSSIVLG